MIYIGFLKDTTCQTHFLKKIKLSTFRNLDSTLQTLEILLQLFLVKKICFTSLKNNQKHEVIKSNWVVKLVIPVVVLIQRKLIKPFAYYCDYLKTNSLLSKLLTRWTLRFRLRLSYYQHIWYFILLLQNKNKTLVLLRKITRY